MPKAIHDHLVAVVNILRDGQYHDGNTIGQQLNLTRSAIWKIIKKLEKYGVNIHCSKSRGYAIAEPLILLDCDKITKNIQHDIKIELYESIDSTNEYLKTLKQVKKPQICLAEHQTRGRGRLNKNWHSPFGQNIYFSCRFPFKKDISELAGLSLVTAIAVLRALKKIGIDDAIQVKWPNDIYYDYKKLCGILHEVFAESYDGIVHAIIGVGINVNILADATDEITQPWTSVRKILQKPVDRNVIIINLINELLDALALFDRFGFTPFMTDWLRHDCLLHKTITLQNAFAKWSGIVMGVNQQGQLLLKLDNGEIKAFSSGDVTVLKKSFSDIIS